MVTNIPQIGIFWILDSGKLIIDAVEWNKSDKKIGNYVSHSDHYQYWENKIRPDLNQEYTDNPRGRVVYNIKTKTAKIMASRSVLHNKILINKIIKAFNLTKYILRADEHYEKANELL
jgi:hypothetical protein